MVLKSIFSNVLFFFNFERSDSCLNLLSKTRLETIFGLTVWVTSLEQASLLFYMFLGYVPWLRKVCFFLKIWCGPKVHLFKRVVFL